jgi:hypothetical protein
MNSMQADERTTHLTGQLAIIFLSLTQVGLLGAILYRRYALGVDPASYNDLRWILGISLFGFIAAKIIAGAHIPLLRARVLILGYIGFVTLLGTILSIWHGLPTRDNWETTILPVLLGPAILLLGYVALCRLRQVHDRRYLSED